MAVLQIPYTTPGNYTYDSDKIGVSGGLASLLEDLTNVYARWHLNESGGTNAPDTGVTGTRNGTTVGTPSWVAGKLNNGLLLNGTTQYVDCGAIAGLERTDVFSLETWAEWTSAASMAFMSKMTSSSSGRGWILFAFTGSVWMLLRTTGANYVMVRTTDATLNDGAFHHIAVTYNGSSLASGVHIWVDGVDQAVTIVQDNLDGTILNAQDCHIGNRAAEDYFAGTIDECVIYTKELTPTEVAYRWNSGTGRENVKRYTKLSAYALWHLDESSGTNVPDSSGNSRDGTTQNMEDADWVAGKLNNALRFDAANTEYVDCGAIAGFEKDEVFSCEVWINTTKLGKSMFIVGKRQLGAPARGWALVGMLSGRLRFQVQSTSATDTIEVETPAVSYRDGAWHHIIATYDGSEDASGVHLYYDGVLQIPNVVTNNLTSTIINAENAKIATIGTGGGNFWEGDLDEVAVYDTELTQEQVAFRYNSGSGREDLPVYPTIERTALFDPANVLSWDNFAETLGGGNQGSVGYNLYKVNKTNEYYWSGAAWVTGGSSDNYNSAATINTNIGTFDGSPDKIGVLAYLLSDGTQEVELDLNQITYSDNQLPIVDAGTNKTADLTETILPFSDSSFSDPDGTVDFARYKVDGEVDVWTNIPQGGYSTLLEAVQAFPYQFLALGVKTVRLQVEDNDAGTSEDLLTVTVSHDTTPPAKASNEAAYDNITNGDIKLTWDRSTDDGIGADDVQYYAIAISTVSAADAASRANAGTFPILFDADDSASYIEIVAGLTNTTQYWFIISPVDNVGNHNTDFVGGDAVTAIPSTLVSDTVLPVGLTIDEENAIDALTIDEENAITLAIEETI